MFRTVALLVIAVLVVVGVWFAQPDQTSLSEQWLKSRLKAVLTPLAEKTPLGKTLRFSIEPEGQDPALAEKVRRLVHLKEVVWLDPNASADEADHVLHVELQSSSHSATIRAAVDAEPAVIRRVAWYSVLPPLLAIATAILFRHVIICLVMGVLAAGVIAVWPTDHSPLYGLWHAFYAYFVRHALLEEFRLEIISFVLLVSATVGLARASGGIQALIDVVTRFCRTARSARLGTALAGLLLFFDDYLNCIVVGNTLRPLTDRHRVSREKLAYIVDSTAAPLAGLAVFSTWIAFETSQINEGLTAAGIAIEPFNMFVRTLPFRFYCGFTIVLVFILAWTGRDYGPMLAAERRAAADGSAPPNGEPHDPRPSKPKAKARYAVVPIGFILIATLVTLWWSGWQRAGRPAIQDATLFVYLRRVLSNADSMWAFSRASALGFLLAVVMLTTGKVMTTRQIVRTSLSSVRVILKAVVILFLAWSIGAACRDVGTADYLVALFRKVLSPVGFSMVVFGLSCLVAFSTGSSFTTMAILLPNVVPLAFEVGQGSTMTGIAMATISIGAVLDGAIFGDHCSPISDTTILSALASRCDAIDHVRTQMPYALTAMAVALAAGYVPSAVAAPPAASWIAGVLAVLLIVRFVGRPIDRPGGHEELSNEMVR